MRRRDPSSERMRQPRTYQYRDEKLEIEKVKFSTSSDRTYLELAAGETGTAVHVWVVNATSGERYTGFCNYSDKFFAYSIASKLYHDALFREEVMGGKERTEELANEIFARVAMLEAGI